mgnify:FL=1
MIEEITIDNLKIIITRNNIKIKDSFKLTDKKQIESFVIKLKYIMLKEKMNTCRTFCSFVREIYAHSYLYNHKMFCKHTKDTDLSENEKLLRRIAYFLIYYMISKNV